MNNKKIEAALQIAFEAGRWQGQVDLEEHYDKEQFSQCVIESVNAKNTSMPLKESSNGREVSVRLRSLKWRNGVKKSSEEYLQRAKEIILENLRN